MNEIGEEFADAIPQAVADDGGDGHAAAGRGTQPAGGKDETGNGQWNLIAQGCFAELAYGFVVVYGMGQGYPRPEETIGAGCK